MKIYFPNEDQINALIRSMVQQQTDDIREPMPDIVNWFNVLYEVQNSWSETASQFAPEPKYLDATPGNGLKALAAYQVFDNVSVLSTIGTYYQTDNLLVYKIEEFPYWDRFDIIRYNCGLCQDDRQKRELDLILSAAYYGTYFILENINPLTLPDEIVKTCGSFPQIYRKESSVL